MKNVPGYLILNRSVSLPLLMVVTTACATGEAMRSIVHQTGGGRLGMRPARVAILVPRWQYIAPAAVAEAVMREQVGSEGGQGGH